MLQGCASAKYFIVSTLVKAAIFQYSDSAAGCTSGYPEIIILAEAGVLSLQGSQRL